MWNVHLQSSVQQEKWQMLENRESGEVLLSLMCCTRLCVNVLLIKLVPADVMMRFLQKKEDVMMN